MQCNDFILADGMHPGTLNIQADIRCKSDKRRPFFEAKSRLALRFFGRWGGEEAKVSPGEIVANRVSLSPYAAVVA